MICRGSCKKAENSFRHNDRGNVGYQLRSVEDTDGSKGKIKHNYVYVDKSDQKVVSDFFAQTVKGVISQEDNYKDYYYGDLSS